MSKFFVIAREGEIADGQGETFEVGGRRIAVFRQGERYHAMDDACPHLGASLGSGEVCGGTVLCNRHRWAFRFEDGGCIDAPTLQAQVFVARLRDGLIEVEL